MSTKNESAFTSRDVVSLTEIAKHTSLSVNDARDVLIGTSYDIESKVELEEYLGMSIGNISVYFGEES